MALDRYGPGVIRRGRDYSWLPEHQLHVASTGTGWPSFSAPVDEATVQDVPDRGLLGARTEVRCRSCGSHLGHVFRDGPRPTGLRFCMNSAALELAEELVRRVRVTRRRAA